MVDAEAIPNVTPLIENTDGKLKRQVCSCLSHIAKHTVELAELVVEGEVFPKIFTLLKDEDVVVKKNAATCIREIAKHSPELAALVVKAGGLPAIVDYTREAEIDNKLPGIMTLGFIAAFSETMATSVIKAKAIAPLGHALETAQSDHVKAAAAWALGQIGRHSSDHAKDVAEANVLKKLLTAYLSDKSSEDLKSKSKKSLKSIIEKCVYLEALDPLLHEEAPQNILKVCVHFSLTRSQYVVNQYSKVLPNNVDAKKKFVTSRGLAKLLTIKAEQGTPLKDSIDLILSGYPDEVVRHYTPNIDKILLSKIDADN